MIEIKNGDVITIKRGGLTVKGTVMSASNYGGYDGWYIELSNANVPGGYSYWKQGFDGGYIAEVNGKSVPKEEISLPVVREDIPREYQVYESPGVLEYKLKWAQCNPYYAMSLLADQVGKELGLPRKFIAGESTSNIGLVRTYLIGTVYVYIQCAAATGDVVIKRTK